MPTPMRATPTAKTRIATSIPLRAPNRASTTVASDSPAIEAIPAPSSMRPIWMLSTSRAILMAGTRDAHVAMLRPLARKIANTAVRQRTSWVRVRTSSMRTLYRIDSTLPFIVSNRFGFPRSPEVASRRHEHTPTHDHRCRPHGRSLAVDGIRRLQRKDRGLGRDPAAGARRRRLTGLHGPRSACGVAAPWPLGHRRRGVRGAPRRGVPRPGQDAHDGRTHRRGRLARSRPPAPARTTRRSAPSPLSPRLRSTRPS